MDTDVILFARDQPARRIEAKPTADAPKKKPHKAAKADPSAKPAPAQ